MNIVSELGTKYLKEFVKQHGLQDKEVINVGCGKDSYDFLPNAINFDEMDWTKYKDCPKNFVRGDAECMPFSNERFDAVILIDMLEHCKHPDKVMREVSRVLKKGGLLCTINTFLFRMHGNEIKGLEYEDYWRFTSHGIKLLCEESGLEIKDNTYYESYIYDNLCYDAMNPDDPGVMTIRMPRWIKIHTVAQK